MQGYNIGSDSVLTILVAGQPVITQILTSFDARQQVAKLKSTAIDGKNRFRNIPQGWEISLEYDRADSVLDDLFADLEAGVYAGLQPPRITITETTTNTDGSIVKYRYEGIALVMDTIGKRAGDTKVEVKISGSASRRIKVQ